MLCIDDIQRQAVDDIHAFGVIWARRASESSPQFAAKALKSHRFYDILTSKGGEKMKKDYNYWITPQNTSKFRSKRNLHILSNTCLVVNLIIFAILLPGIRLWTLGLAFCFLAYTFLQLFDKRKDQWAWWVIIFGIVLSVAISVCYILLFNLYLYFIVIAAQAIISTAIFYIFNKK